MGRCVVFLIKSKMGAVNSSRATLSLHFSLTNYLMYPSSSSVNNDCIEVGELIFEIADYKNDFADTAPEKLFRKCSTSWGAY